jgi:alginate O-acetyltransferase complex protein AlgI
MLFTSLEFMVLFLPVVLGVALSLRGGALLSWIALASCVFYAFAGHAWFLIPMAVSTIIDFLVGHQLAVHERPSTRKALLWFSLVSNLGLLAYFKYSGLLVRSIQDLSATLGQPASPLIELGAVILPAGISFYTFQTMSYVIDIYRRHAEPERSFVKYLTFVSFFPHLVAGPLTRHNQLIPQLSRIAGAGIQPAWRAGIVMFAFGLLKKVCIADRLGNWVDPQIADLGNAGAVEAWLALIGYSMQLYFDFSGYSDMAVGLGRLFNVELPQNFNSPYRALDPSDFWKRWHISLSQWLRDYLYIGLGGNRCSEWRRNFNLIVTMFLGGLWHGAHWTFALWGLYHGVLIALHHRFSAQWGRLSTASRRVSMFMLVCIGWVFFRADSLEVALDWFQALAGGNGIVQSEPSVRGLVLPCGLVLTATILATLGKNTFELEVAKLSAPRLWALGSATAVAVLLMNFASKFLYYQF